jgi:hypothetical protein
MGEAVYTSDIREVLAFINSLPVQKYLLTSAKALAYQYKSTNTAVQICARRASCAAQSPALTLLALLVQKYKY